MLGSFVSCIEPYEKSFKTMNKIVIVEGLVHDGNKQRAILLKESWPSPSGSSSIKPLVGAKVNVVVDGEKRNTLTEKDPGVYQFDENFIGEIGKKYKLEFITTDGNVFVSNEEVLKPSVAIKKMNPQLDEKAIIDIKGVTTAGYKLFIDLDDPKQEKNHYLWDWMLYERQNVCSSCTGGYYYRTPLPLGRCVDDAILKRYNNIFDYQCEVGCWEIMRSADLNVLADEFVNGNAIKAQLIGKIPLYQYQDALLWVNQYSISKEAYDFIHLSQQQGVKTGSLADTPPARLNGNIKCTSDPSINTSGYFIVAGKSPASYWLSKAEAFERKLKPVGLLGGRETRFEPSGASTIRPPMAPCVNGLNRTNQKPEGWQN
jgi:Domain of unknown function (DUF4249)